MYPWTRTLSEPRSLLEADREALDEVGDAGKLLELEPLRRGGIPLRGGVFDRLT
jgi:hypothetical protein